jgi:hypothetical protein
MTRAGSPSATLTAPSCGRLGRNLTTPVGDDSSIRTGEARPPPRPAAESSNGVALRRCQPGSRIDGEPHLIEITLMQRRKPRIIRGRCPVPRGDLEQRVRPIDQSSAVGTMVVRSRISMAMAVQSSGREAAELTHPALRYLEATATRPAALRLPNQHRGFHGPRVHIAHARLNRLQQLVSRHARQRRLLV